MLTLTPGLIEDYLSDLVDPGWNDLKVRALDIILDSITESPAIVQHSPVAYDEASKAFEQEGTDIGAEIVDGYINRVAQLAMEQLAARSLMIGADYFKLCTPIHALNAAEETCALPRDEEERLKLIMAAVHIGFCLQQCSSYLLHRRDFSRAMHELQQEKSIHPSGSEAYDRSVESQRVELDDFDNALSRLTTSINQMQGTAGLHQLDRRAFHKVLKSLTPHIEAQEVAEIDMHLTMPHRPALQFSPIANTNQLAGGITYN